MGLSGEWITYNRNGEKYKITNINQSEKAAAQAVTKRPHSVTVIGWLFIVAGLVGLAYHASEFKAGFKYELVWVCCVRLLAIICGVFVLRGSNWARWLLLAWLAYHVVLSALHSWSGVVIHSLLLGAVAYFLFRPQASAYYHGTPALPGNRD